MSTVTKESLLNEIMFFYDQYLYVKDIVYTFIDADATEERQCKSNNFFKMAASACIDSYSMTLARLFDQNKNKKSETIFTLIDKCKKSIDLFQDSADVMNYLSKYIYSLTQDSDLNNAIKLLKYRRNKYFAHNDKKFMFLDVTEDLPDGSKNHLPSYQLWMLIRNTGNLLRTLAYKLDGCELDKIMLPKYNGDLRDILDCNCFPKFPLVEL